MGVFLSWVFSALLSQVLLYSVVVESNSSFNVRLDTQCNNKGMVVRAEFDTPFKGVIFAKGYFKEPSCRFVRRNSALTQYEFLIHYDTCGVQPRWSGNSTSAPARYESVLVLQNDPMYHDAVRKISCKYRTNALEKNIDFPLLMVDTIDVITFSVEKDKIECWMDVQRGTFPETIPIEGSVKIGENLTIYIFIRINVGKLDVRVRDCWAYDSLQFDNPKKAQLQLTDTNGCPLKTSLIEQWNRAYNTRTHNDTTLVAYTTVKSFRFPENPNVYLRCTIEVCKDKCEHPCSGESTEIKTVPLETLNRLVSDKRFTPIRPPPVAQQSPGFTPPVHKPLVPVSVEAKHTSSIGPPGGIASSQPASSGFRPPAHKPSLHQRVGHRPPLHKPSVG